ncbi:uncharacterized protein EKO05_0003645 [Ascochyta rabiei]|uniref:Uncharacterized protein n=1 Tax=Didymella rabiei TaxID=5454 RepID=A0A162YTE3_DIDRA|nr:uncharacterized protein EKO05_0003645 [Ascochyta rabiei]KZM20218.1 hypothetical protein ST47_g8622 [Ascochyta rabiei]UPX13119.1 hypothetical protein EKO05_0003645 [Ascochyta rabiei]
MFGIGPMLPVIPAVENVERSSKKVWKRKNRHDQGTDSHELAVIRLPSTIKTETTLIEFDEEFAVKQPERVPHHQRDLSLTVHWRQEDLERMARELNDGVISDLDLSLFVFWVKAKHGNYLYAKELIRELALDQGYNIDRISNVRVRKLLQEVHDARPRSVPGKGPSLQLSATDGSRQDWRRSLATVLTPVTARGKVWFAAVGESAKTRSNKLNTRDPQHTSTWDSSFQNQTWPPDMRTIDNIRAVTSPLTARMDSLPPSLRLERERVVQEAARVSIISNDTVDYPPNTPDRPAPLSVKSRGSRASSATPLPNAILRSVSTPVRTQPRGELVPLSPVRADVMMGDTETLSFVSSFSTTHSTLFTDKLNSSKAKHHGTNKRYMYKNADDHHHRGPFQLDASDAASESGYGTFSSLMRKDKDRASGGLSYDGVIIGDGSFDALESYIGTEDEEDDDCSILESTSTLSELQAQTQYRYAVERPIVESVIAESVPTPSQRHVTAEARHKSRVSNVLSPGINFHRPLPLRSYESEATMFPTANARANSGHNRATSVTSIIASRRATTETMPLPPLHSSVQPHDNANLDEQQGCERGNSHTKISDQVGEERVSVSQCSSNASTLAAFPIPPMENPVGELPMLVSRAMSQLHTTASQLSVAPALLDDTYRAIIKVNMDALLQRTRARGEQLQVVEWDKLSSFERAWREMNNLVLVTVYGRNDIVLSNRDVKYIDCVSRELRGGANNDVPFDWVRRMFEGDIQ